MPDLRARPPVSRAVAAWASAGAAVVAAVVVCALAWFADARQRADAAAAEVVGASVSPTTVWEPTAAEAVDVAVTWLPSVAALVALVLVTTRRADRHRALPATVVVVGALAWTVAGWAADEPPRLFVGWPFPVVPQVATPGALHWTVAHPAALVALAGAAAVVVAGVAGARCPRPRTRPAGRGGRMTSALVVGGASVLAGALAVGLTVDHLWDGAVLDVAAVAWSLAAPALTLVVVAALVAAGSGDGHGLAAAGLAVVWLAGGEVGEWWAGGPDRLLLLAAATAVAVAAPVAWRPLASAVDGLLADRPA